jgi:hypothetical protein
MANYSIHVNFERINNSCSKSRDFCYYLSRRRIGNGVNDFDSNYSTTLIFTSAREYGHIKSKSLLGDLINIGKLTIKCVIQNQKSLLSLEK